MQTYIIRRLALSVITLVGVITLIFVVVRLAPGNPVDVLLGDYYTEESVAHLREKLDLDKPVIVQYFTYLHNMLRGDFGMSYATGEPVLQQLLLVLPHTIYLAFGSIIFSLSIGITTGVMAALNRNGWVDMVSMTFASAFMAIPGFYLGLLLILFFSLQLGILPALGTGEENFASLVIHLILPSIALGGPSAAIIARMTRSSLLEVLGKDYVRTARSKGVRERMVVIKHAMRNAMTPVLAMAGLSFARRFGGSAIIEILFSRRGLGSLLVNAIFDRDYVMVQLAVLFFAFTLILVNILVDISYSVLDPRIRYE